MEIKHPTLLIQESRCKKNIHTMKARADQLGLALHPHFKTHQSRIIGKWFKEAGVQAITVSSIAMAKYFADGGWKNITIAFPANILAVAELNLLTQKVDLTILVDNLDTARWLNENIEAGINILVELDAGSRRTGIDVDRYEAIKEVVSYVRQSRHLHFQGFYSHFGHTYSCRGADEIKKVFEHSLGRINKMRAETGLTDGRLHLGDTPGCSIAGSFKGVDVITPGNFVFYDTMQQNIGSCQYEDIAVAMACPVVSKRADRSEITIHGGAVHFSKDFLQVGEIKKFGIMVELTKEGIGRPMQDAYLKALSQEHGIMHIPEEFIKKIKVGDLIGVLPVHSCLTAQCMGEYKSFDDQILDHM